jgi:hypothetical protein
VILGEEVLDVMCAGRCAVLVVLEIQGFPAGETPKGRKVAFW